MLHNSTTTRRVSLNLDTLVAAYESRPATRTRAKAWQWLAEIAAVTFQGDALIVPSATWSHTRYLATPETCSCPARGHCHHKESASIVAAALAEDARYDEMAAAMVEALPFDLAEDLTSFAPVKRSPSIGYTAALSDLLECF